VGFEPTIAVLERAKTVRALDRAATAIGSIKLSFNIGEDLKLMTEWKYGYELSKGDLN
jgi:hypothetical protein